MQPAHRFTPSSVLALGLGLALLSSALGASDAPSPPESPLTRLVGQLAQKRPAQKPGAPAPAPPSKEELLRPEFRFKPAKKWLLLPQLAEALGTNEEERAAVLELMNQGAREARKLLAAEGAENDVAAATAVFMSQLWQVVRQEELPEAHVDALHAQIVGVMAGPDVAKMPDADKQRYWEFCLGYPIFILGMAEVIETDEQRADLRTAAAVGFETLIGVRPELVDIGPAGLTIRAGVEEAAGDLAKEADDVVRVSPIRTPEAKPPAPAVVPGSREKLPASGPAIAGITYTPPAGWTRETNNGNTIFRATLVDVNDQGQPEPDNSASHQATIGVLPVLSAGGAGPTALFDQTWRDQFATFVPGDTQVHYRARIPSNLVVLYMGRFFKRPDAPAHEGTPDTYGVLYLVDLGGNRFQPIVALVEPRDPGIGMDTFKEGRAFTALSFPLGALLDSIKPPKGAPPYPAGGVFAPADFVGNWTQSSSTFGGHYYNTATGAHAGVATTASGGHLFLRADRTYEYAFAYTTTNPRFGNSADSEKHAGRYSLDGDVVLTEASQPVAVPLKRCAVGIGSRQTAAGLKRILVLVGADSGGVFRAPQLIPNWDYYSGVMDWYVEK